MSRCSSCWSAVKRGRLLDSLGVGTAGNTERKTSNTSSSCDDAEAMDCRLRALEARDGCFSGRADRSFESGLGREGPASSLAGRADRSSESGQGRDGPAGSLSGCAERSSESGGGRDGPADSFSGRAGGVVECGCGRDGPADSFSGRAGGVVECGCGRDGPAGSSFSGRVAGQTVSFIKDVHFDFLFPARLSDVDANGATLISATGDTSVRMFNEQV